MFAVLAIKSPFPRSVISHMNSRDKVGEEKKGELGLGGVNKQMTYCQNLNVIALALQIATEIL